MPNQAAELPPAGEDGFLHMLFQAHPSRGAGPHRAKALRFLPLLPKTVMQPKVDATL
jgi:hypothetical protein